MTKFSSIKKDKHPEQKSGKKMHKLNGTEWNDGKKKERIATKT